MTLRVRSQPQGAGPHYLIIDGNRVVGDVYRTGTLRSCHRWHAVIRADAKAERPDWPRLISRATRADVVADFTEAWEATP